MSGIVRANNAGQSGIASNIETIDSDDYVDDSIDTAHIAVNQVTLAEMAGITRGSIIYGDASGDPAALAKGTEDYVLTAGADDVAWAAAGGLSAASRAEMEAGSSNTVAVTPGRQQYHDSAVKAWGRVTYSGGTPSLSAVSYNVTDVDDDAVGQVTFNLTVAMSTATYSAVASVITTNLENGHVAAHAVGSIRCFWWHITGDPGAPAGRDPDGGDFAAFGVAAA